MAFVIFPVFGGAGMVAKSAVTSFESLPTDLKTPPDPVRSRILAADGKTVIGYFYKENRIPVSLSQVPDITQKSVIAIEDSRFYEHKGVDLRGISRAFVRNQTDGELVQGASTITQQYVKRVLLQDALQKGDKKAAEAAVDKNQDRKIREIRYALALEERLSKAEILERYLNIAYYGSGAYGIGAAAQVYFGKPVSLLTLTESALLAGLLQSPSRYDPTKNKGVDAVGRRNVVLARMGQLGFISPAEAEKAIKEPLKLNRRTIPNGCAKSKYGHFCDYVRRYLLDSPAFGTSREARQDRLFKGGLTIRTTLDPRQQALADQAMRPTFSRGSRYAAGIAVVQPGTGRVTAIAHSRTFNEDQNPYVTSRQFQTGSTAKAFVLTAALAKGMPLTTVINSPHDYTSPIFRDGGKAYSLSNDASGMHGNYDMRSGIAASVNTYFVQLEERVGVDNAVRTALAMGIHNPVDPATGKKEFDDYIAYPRGYGSFTLGVAGITPLDMAVAYATLAAKGVRCYATPIDSAVDATGKVVNVGRRDCKRTIDEGVAAAAAEALSWVVNPKGPVINGNTGGGAAIGRGQPVAGKTGTTQEIKEAWFVGFTPHLSAASVVFDPKHQVTLPGGDRSNRIAVRAWARFMKATLATAPVIRFPRVPSTYLRITGHRIPDVAGMSLQEAARELTRVGFNVAISPQQVPAGPVPPGRVGLTNPPAGTRLAEGSLVTLFVSNGQPPPGGQPCKPGRPGCPP